MLPEREEKIRDVVEKRQFDLTVVLDNVHDPHNISAVLRTCDSVGVKEIYILYTDERHTDENISMGKKSSAGARKWVDVHYYRDPQKCFSDLRKKYDKIYYTAIDENSQSLYNLNLSDSVALVFGNEHQGLMSDCQKYTDGCFYIPQVGFTQSLNISVACAVSLYEAFRQRQKKSQESENLTQAQRDLFEDYCRRDLYKKKGKQVNHGD